MAIGKSGGQVPTALRAVEQEKRRSNDLSTFNDFMKLLLENSGIRRRKLAHSVDHLFDFIESCPNEDNAISSALNHLNGFLHRKVPSRLSFSRPFAVHICTRLSPSKKMRENLLTLSQKNAV